MHMSDGRKTPRLSRLTALALLITVSLLTQGVMYPTLASARLRSTTQGDPGDGDLSPQPTPAKAYGLTASLVPAQNGGAPISTSSENRRNSIWIMAWLIMTRIMWVMFRR